jgi:hypothetical protein
MGFLVRSGGLAPEDPNCSDNEEFHDRPADEGHYRGDVQDGTAGAQGIGVEDAVERRDEDLAHVEDPGHESVGLASIEHEEHDPQSYEALHDPECEDRDTPGELAVARSGFMVLLD